MLEEKSVKHWLKRKVKFTEALLVAFLITGGIAGAEESIHYHSTNDNGIHTSENYNNDGAKAKNAVVIGIGSTSDGVNSIVLGNNTKVTKNTKNPEDDNSSVVVGNNLDVDGVHNVIVGTDYHNYDQKFTKINGDHNAVLGTGNLIGYTAKQNGNSWSYTKSENRYDQNTVVGMNNTVNTNGNTVLGSSNEIKNNGSVISVGSGNVVGGTIINDSGKEEGVGLRSGVFGHDSSVSHNEAFVFGNESKATAMEAYVLGNSSENTGKNSIVLGNYAKNESIGGSILGSHAENHGEWGTALGGCSNVTVDYGVALGAFSTANTSSGIAGYDPSGNSADNSSTWRSTLAAVSIGDSKEGYTRQITNVAAGTEDTDVVNVAQLKALKTGVQEEITEVKKISEILQSSVREVHSESKRIGALSSALAALNPMEYDPMKPNQVLAGVGSYKNSQAVAVGMSHHFNENLRVQAGVSVSEGRRTESMVNLGLAWKIGKDDRDDSYNKYKEGPISSIYVLQDEVIFLKQANQKKDKEIDELKMLVKKLMSEK